jgi:hypothetical protein
MHQRSLGVVFLSLLMTGSIVPAYSAEVSTESNIQKRVVNGKEVQSERDEQEALFNYYFRNQNLKYETKLSELKESASVPSWRIPYSASIHPEQMGGMSGIGGGRGRRAQSSGGVGSPMSVYDQAFNSSNQAVSYEKRRLLGGESAFFVGARLRRNNEGWEGYCSGFTASTIRHPEPVKAVDAGEVGGKPGVVFQPSDIKALLSSIYNRTTNDSYLYLAPPSAKDGGPNMATFHLALANYIGQAGSAIGIDRTKGSAPWNNPIYAYEITSIADAGEGDHLHYKKVENTVTYSFYGTDAGRQTDQETGDIHGNVKQVMHFRYILALDDDGRIVGGSSLSDNGYFLWLPLYAIQAKEDGSVGGNPYVDVQKVIALARASALPANQKKFDEVTIGQRMDGSAKAEEESKDKAEPKQEKEPTGQEKPAETASP